MRAKTMSGIRANMPPIRAALLAFAVALFLSAPVAPSWAGGSTAQGTIVAKVDGMSCPFCTYGLRKELLTIPGVKDVQVSLVKSEATLQLDPGSNVTDDQIRQAVHQAGFSPAAITHE